VCVQKSTTTTTTTTANKKKNSAFLKRLFFFLFFGSFRSVSKQKEGHEKHNKKKERSQKKNEALSKKVSPQQTTATKKTNRIKRAFFEQKTCQKTTSFCIFVFPREREPRFSFFFAKKRGLPLLFCPSKRFLIECLVCCVFGEKKKLCSVFRGVFFFLFGVVPCLDSSHKQKKTSQRKKRRKK